MLIISFQMSAISWGIIRPAKHVKHIRHMKLLSEMMLCILREVQLEANYFIIWIKILKWYEKEIIME